MGLTPIYQLPYPEATDPADVPIDMRELADRLEVVLPVLRPQYAGIETSELIPSGSSYQNAATVGPQLTIPTAGNYLISWGAALVADPNIAFAWYAALKFGAAATDDGDSVIFYGPSAGGASTGGSISRSRQYSSLAAGTVVLMQYKAVNYGTNASRRWLTALKLN